MNIDALVARLTPEMFTQLQTVVEIGRWPDGNRVDDEQRAMLIQARMIWQSKFDGEREEPYTVSKDGELRLSCESERERLEAAFGDTFSLKIN